VWNSHPESLTVIVQPSLWQKPSFRGLLAAALLGVIAALVYYFSTQKLQRQVALLRQQEALERERSRIARDLHDQLGANLTQVALLAEMAESDKNIPDEVEDHAKQITQTARETTKALDEIVWAVRPGSDSLQSLVEYIAHFANELFKGNGVRCRLDLPDNLPERSLPPEMRHNIFLIAKEALTNSMRHSEAKEISVEIKVGGDWLDLVIKDDGRGFDATGPYCLAREDHCGRSRELLGREQPESVAHDGGHTVSMELKFGAVAKRLEPENLKLLQFEQHILLRQRARTINLLDSSAFCSDYAAPGLGGVRHRPELL